jgi:lon-related putative ATP-dependent protease
MPYYLLYSLDNEFQKLFKVRADFASDMDWTDDNVARYARFIGSRTKEDGLLDFSPDAVCKVVEYGSRLAEDRNKLSARFAHIADIVSESAYWAQSEGHTAVDASDVTRAIEERVYRSNQIEERIHEAIRNGLIVVNTEGSVVGQVNGLSVVGLGDYAFGKPSRITARVFMGRAGVVNIEREVKLSGPIHDKGVLILSGYLGAKYALDKPLALSATIAFEQSYEGVEGDSASSTELYALLSALAEAPIMQNIAVTGSVDQRGEVQPVGGVQHKIEGFYDTCKARGLTGEQGVMMPRRNLRNLMVREDVVEAVRQGQFHIWAVSTIDEGIELLTGVAAGAVKKDGSYPRGTIHRRVHEKLSGMADRLAQYAASGELAARKDEQESR